MKPGNDRDERRLFLNGLDEDWRSDSSADVEAGISSPSVRTRQQSITTAATSVDTHFASEGRRIGGCASVAGTPGKQAVCFAGGDGETWVDLEIEALNAEEDSSRGIGSSVACQELDQSCQTRSTLFGMEGGDKTERDQQYLISIPQRRSSRGRHIPTVILGETAHSTRACRQNFTEELASQLQLPQPQDPSHHFPSDHLLQNNWDESEAAYGPVVPTGRRQLRHNLQPNLTQVVTDQLSLPPLSTAETTYYDAPPSPRTQTPSLLSKPLNSQSVSRMPLFTNVNVHSWLQSSGGGGHLRSRPILSPTSSVSMSPPTNIRVSTEVLENLRIIVGNFPETMLRTSTLTVETIRSYSRKLKHGDFGHERVLVDQASTIAKSPTSPQQPSLGRKASLGNLSLMSSLRGKFTSRFGHSATSPTLQENGENSWPPVDHNATPQSTSPPSRQSEPQIEACVIALRTIFPQGTDYILDAMCAHVIVYNYINSLCSGLPHQEQNGTTDMHLRTQPSKSFVLPPGVTSLADLKCQPDVSETVVRDFQNDAASIASKSVVPSKAASLLGLGSTNMGKPGNPNSGTISGRQAKLRKLTHPGK